MTPLSIKRLAWAAALTVIAIPAAIFVMGQVDVPAPKLIDVRPPRWWHPTGNTDPVATDLYDYHPNNQRYPDRVVSGPLRLRFPKSAYVYRENQQGGPQYSITLALDRRTLAPFYTPEKLAALLKLSAKDQAVYGRAGRMLVTLSTGLDVSPSAKVFDDRLRKGELHRQGSFCGLAVAYNPRSTINRRFAPLLVHGVDLNGGGVEAVAEGPRDEAPVILCSEINPQCIVHTKFRNKALSLELPKREICTFRQEIDRVSVFLNHHVTSRANAGL